MAESWCLVPGSGKETKRVASRDLEETKRALKMQKQWGAVTRIAANTRQMTDVYVAEYGELKGPPAIIHDPSLDPL
jgi:hypothetical protein